MPSEAKFQSLRWLAGTLSTSLAIVFMQMSATTHPPAGATALLAAVNDDVMDIGWYYLPVILLSSTLVLAVALLVNNIQRKYPIYWFEPHKPAAPAPAPAPLEKGKSGKGGDTNGSATPVEDEGNEAQVEAKEIIEDRV